MSSIKEKIRESYETGNIITLEKGQYMDITVEDIVAILQLVINKPKGHPVRPITCPEFRYCDTYFNRVEIREPLDHPHILATLYIIDTPFISGYTVYNEGIIDCEDNQVFFEGIDELMELLEETGIIHYDVTRHLLIAFGIDYDIDTELGEQYIKNYLGLNTTKSSRNV